MYFVNCRFWWEVAGERMKTQDWSPDGGQSWRQTNLRVVGGR